MYTTLHVWMLLNSLVICQKQLHITYSQLEMSVGHKISQHTTKIHIWMTSLYFDLTNISTSISIATYPLDLQSATGSPFKGI